MKRILTLCLLLTACHHLTGCNHLTVNQGAAAPDAPTRIVTIHSYLWGFLPTQVSPSLCEEKTARSYHFFMDSGDVGLTLLTLGVYVPAEVELSCQ